MRTVRLVRDGEGGYAVCLELDGPTRKALSGFAHGSREIALAFAHELAAEPRVMVEEATS